MPSEEESLERYVKVHNSFSTEKFRVLVDELLNNRIKMLIIETDPELRGLVAGDFNHQLGAWKGESLYCVDLISNTAEEALMKQLFGREKYIIHYNLVYIGSTLDKDLADRIIKRVKENGFDAKVIQLSDLEKICTKILSEDQRRPSRIYTAEEAIEQLKRVTEDIRNGRTDGILEVLHIDSLLSPVFDPTYRPTEAIAIGERVTPGSSSAPSYTSLSQAGKYAKRYPTRKITLVADRLTPEYTRILPFISGVLTKERLMEGSHIKAFISSMGIPCISYSNMVIREDGVYFGTSFVENGTHISMDGSSGEIYKGDCPVIPSQIIQDAQNAKAEEHFEPSEPTKVYRAFLEEVKTVIEENNGMSVYAFVSNADEAKLAKMLSMDGGKAIVDGVGMVKTEIHFSNEKNRADLCNLLLSKDISTEEQAKKRILDAQQELFYNLLNEMCSNPVQIRLLDSLGDLFKEGPLHSNNPFVLRGVDITLQYPIIHYLQIEAIIRAAYDLRTKEVKPRIVIPYIRNEREVEYIAGIISSVYEKTGIKKQEIDIPLGIMVETPLVGDRIAKLYHKGAHFFVFGTNDLTSSSLCIPRGEAKPTFLRAQAGIYPKDPFECLVEPIRDKISKVVGDIKRLGKNIPFGVTGRHARDPQSILFFHQIGMHYVAVPPYEVPQTLHHVARAAYMEPRI